MRLTKTTIKIYSLIKIYQKTKSRTTTNFLSTRYSRFFVRCGTNIAIGYSGDAGSG
jgi:hypothetical protein